MQRDTGHVPAGVDKEKVLACKTIRDFDTAATIVSFGFPTVEAYYENSTSCGHLHEFPIPTFALNAEDDPIQPGFCK